MGTHDTPKVIDLIKTRTKVDKITYIGHSEGTTQIMAGASLIPDFYKDSFKLAVFLAPPASLMDTPIAILQLLSFKGNRQFVEWVLDNIGIWNILPYNYATTFLNTKFCTQFDGQLCAWIMSPFVNLDPDVDNQDRQTVMNSNSPSGACFRNWLHYGQMVDQTVHGFARYDHGDDENMQRYGQKTPPSYDLSKLDFPISIHSGSQDPLADPSDVQWL